MLDDGDSTIKVKELVEVGTKLEKVDVMDVIDAKEKNGAWDAELNLHIMLHYMSGGYVDDSRIRVEDLIMEDNTCDSVATNLINKIKNNDSKMVKDGKLSMSDIDGKMLGNGWEDPKIQAMKASEQVVNTTNFVLPIENVEIAHNRFANSLVIKDDDDVYYFKFTSLTGLEQVLEKGPWMIRNQPMIFTKWAPNLSISKGTITKVPIWAKVHKVPVVAYSEDGLSLIASQIGKPIMLDAFTSAMCLEPCGRIGFVRALIEVSAEKDLKKEVTMAVLVSALNVVEPVTESNEVQSDGFAIVKNKKNKGKKVQPRNIEGIKLSKPRVNFVWEKKQPNKDNAPTSKAAAEPIVSNVPVKPVSPPKVPEVALKNSFASLTDEDASARGDDQTWINAKQALNVINESDTDDDEELVLEDQNGRHVEDKHVRHVISENNLSVYAILESYVDNSKLHNLCSLVFRHWDWTSNGSFCSKGTRIILGWNHNDVDVVVINQDDQAIHTHLGAFLETSMLPCFWMTKLLGIHFTWSQKPKGKDGVLKKIDRIMANLGFNDMFVGAHAIFRPFCVSDHAPSILCIPTVTKPKPRPFKFFNILTCNDIFKDVVAEGNLHANVIRLRDELDKVQTCLDADPFYSSLRGEEAVAVVAFNEALIMEEKSRIDVVASVDGTLFENDKVAEAFVSHYENFLGQPGITGGFDSNNLFKAKLEDNTALHMVRTIFIFLAINLSEKWICEELPPLLFLFFSQIFQSLRIHAFHSKLFYQEVKSFSRQSFDEDVR
ncbi:hypothetical protein Tco_0117517 [Tanacetum coccineum]